MKPKTGSLLALVLVLAGCPKTFTLPMTALQLAEYNSGPALVAYLSQPNATVEVCDAKARGPHLTALDKDLFGELVAGLRDGKIEGGVWRRCMDALAGSLDPAHVTLLMDVAASTYQGMLHLKELETDPALQARMAALHKLYLERPSQVDAEPAVTAALLDDLRKTTADPKLGPVALRFGREMLASLELAQGLWNGAKVDQPMLDGLQQSGDEQTLRLFADRLGDAGLRDQARRRIIRLHIKASPYQEVRDDPQGVEDRVMKDGANKVSTVDHPPKNALLDQSKLPLEGVVVRQSVSQQTATLLAVDKSHTTLGVLPEMSLRGALTIQLDGIGRPLSFCGTPRDLDPSPCVDVEETSIDNPHVFLDRDGSFHMVEKLSADQAVALAKGGRQFRLPIKLAGKTLMTVQWSLRFEKPDDLTFSAERPGQRGPSVDAQVDHTDPARYVWTVKSQDSLYKLIVEKADAPNFHVTAKGAAGTRGANGSAGAEGSPGGRGTDAVCPSISATDGGAGAAGGPGSYGGAGADGGDGGDLTVKLACLGKACDDAPLVKASAVSLPGEGGAGGAGGEGGAGGAGGKGGAGATCGMAPRTIPLPPGRDGPAGSRGENGRDGQPGQPGRPGNVDFSVL